MGPDTGADGSSMTALRSDAQIRVCGSLHVEIDGQVLEPRLPGRRGQLIAYLVIHRERGVRREELIDALWPANPPSRPEAAFATLLTRTRAAVGHSAIGGAAHLRLELGAKVRVDWEVARQAPEAARQALVAGDPAEALRRAEEGLAIVEQGFLTDFEAPWIDDRRRELDELRGPLAEVLARAALSLGGESVATAERAARAMIEHNPFREGGYAVLIEALAAGGNDAEAMRVYDQLRTLLRDQLGLTPSPAVTALAERILTRGTDSGDAHATDGDRPPRAEVVAGPPALPRAIAAVAQRPLVARGPERQRLLRIADEVAAGTRRVVLVSGEPGIGKTRLAACLASLLSERGWNVLYGRADHESVLTYQPLIEALRQHLADQPEVEFHVREMLGPELVALSRMIPALRPLADAAQSVTPADAELERFRVFEAVAALLASAATQRPALLILDDLHWADRSSITLLRHVVRTTEGCSLFILGTFRDPHDGVDMPLRDFIDELWREGLLEQVALEGLAPAETADLIRRHVPELSAPVIYALYERTDGNPFYVEETLRDLADTDRLRIRPPVDEGFAIPERVKQMIDWRVDRLPAPANDVLRSAAVLGTEFEIAPTAAISGLPPATVLEAVEHARRAALVVAEIDRPDRYSFRHALIREALYESMVPGRRARLHLGAGQALVQDGAGAAQAAEVAVHFSHALPVGGAEAAVRWRMAAAEEATLRHAHEEALDHRRHALEALDMLAPDDRSRALITLGQGQSLVRLGDLEEGRTCLLKAAELARRLGAGDILADCALDAGSFYLSPGDVQDDVVVLLEESLRLLDREEDHVRGARVRARLAVALYWDPPSRRRTEQLAEEAVELARAAGDTGALAQAMASLHSACWVSERPAVLLAEADQVIELAQSAQDMELELVARTWRLNHLLALARVSDADEEIERFVGLAERLGQSRCSWYAPLFLAIRSMMNGQLELAEERIIKAAELGARIPGSTSAMLAGAQLFFLRMLQGRLAELESAVFAYVQSFPRQPAWRCALAFLHAQLGHHDSARALIDELATGEFSAIPQDNIRFVALTLLAEAAAMSGAAPHLPVLERLLSPYAGVCILSPDAAWLGPVDRVLGLLAAAQGRADEGLRRLTAAGECCERVRAASFLAVTRLDEADVRLARGEPGDEDAARACARSALATADAAGMQLATVRALTILDGPRGGGDRVLNAHDRAGRAVAAG
jgi:DNA-binding SARP family transcriptional activator